MLKRWELLAFENREKNRELSQELNNLDETLTNILLQRGVDTFEKAKNYFRPSLLDMHDPFLMKDMDSAVQRLEQAFSKRENILIYGDYDVDGTTSVALVYSYLTRYYPPLKNNEFGIAYYIPDRYAEGYGVSYQGIDYAAENNFTLVIALDCGIKAIEKVAYAKKKGVDFIICDHHQPGEELPPAVAILDQKREGCGYPYKELSGCGVGFKFMQAWTKKTEKKEDILLEYLDLLAISICADIVPITGENRLFVYHGLKVINTNPRVGIKTMIELAVLNKELTVTDIVFTLAPRINAAGRIATGKKAVEILVSDEKKEAMQFGGKINRLNEDRKSLDRAITKEALSKIEASDAMKNACTTVLYHENWHKGVIGIVASRLIESYYRPTVILTKSDDKATGSVRSVKGFNVYNAIEACSDLLDQFGGHKYAAGLTLPIKNVEAFTSKFEEVVEDQIDKVLLVPQVTIDAELNLNQITDKFIRLLKQFAPFGPENRRPVFLSKNVMAENVKEVGEGHLKMEVFQENDVKRKFSCIGFRLRDNFERINPELPLDLVFSIEENYWNGKHTIQLNVKDFRQ